MLKILRTHGFIIPVVVFLAIFAGVWVTGYLLAGHNATYPLDDTYIHIALAKQLAETGTWGVTPGEYTFCSSSPLWTVILAICYHLFGVLAWLPGALAVLSAVVALYFADQFWKKEGVSVRVRVVGGVLFALVTPFAVLAHIGMEHAFHVACIVMFAGAAIRVLEGNESRKSVGWLCLSAALATGARYESLFLLGPLICWFFWERRFRIGLFLGLAASLPVVLYGAYSLLHMGHFLPVTLLLKGCIGVTNEPTDGLCDLLGGSWRTLDLHFALLALLGTMACQRIKASLRKLAGVCVLAICAQFILARTNGALCRYEAYLIALCLLCVVVAAGAFVRKLGRGWFVFLLAGSVPFFFRAVMAHSMSVQAPREIFGQQVQLSRIFSTLPENEKGVVAINDLGYLALHAECPFFDLWGLGSWDMAEILLSRGDTPLHLIYKAAIEVHKVRYVAVFDDWYPQERLPPYLCLVAKMVTCPRIVCGGVAVALYVANEKDKSAFREHLKRVEPSLPKGTRLFFSAKQPESDTP